MPAKPRVPNLSRYPVQERYCGLDTETNGLALNDEAKMMSAAFWDGTTVSFAWGLADKSENNCTRAQAQEFLTDLDRHGFTKVFHNAQFDTRMLYNAGMHFDLYSVEDTGTIAPLLNELTPSFSLSYLGETFVGKGKLVDEDLINWCAENFGGQKTHKVQVENYWKSPFWKIAPYCEQDAFITLELFKVLRPKINEEGLENLYNIESNLFPMLMKMHWAGVRSDVKRAERLYDRLTEMRKQVEFEWDKGVAQLFKKHGMMHVLEEQHGKINVRSFGQMEILFDMLKLPYPRNPVTEGMRKKALRKGQDPDALKGNGSFKSAFLETVEHPLIQKVSIARKLSHYSDTFIEAYILKNADKNGIIHGEFHPMKTDNYGTVSGRFSSGGQLNLQNIPTRSKMMVDFEGTEHPIGKLLRSLFLPRPKGQWIKIDYSQIEYRFLAHYCAMLPTGGQLREAYRGDAGVDFHEAVAKMVGIDRDSAKAINFGIVYGMGKDKLARSLGVSRSEAEDILRDYHGRAPEIREMYNFASRRASRRGFIKTWGGRLRRFSKQISKYGGIFDRTHIALNALLQGSAADLLKVSMVEVDKIIDWDSVVCRLTVHDELDFDIDGSAESYRMIRDVKRAMEQFQDKARSDLFGFRHPISVPVVAEMEIGPNWGTLSKIDIEKKVGTPKRMVRK